MNSQKLSTHIDPTQSSPQQSAGSEEGAHLALEFTYLLTNDWFQEGDEV